MRPLLEVTNLTVEFQFARARITGVDQLSLAIDQGEAVGMLGESGCGKTTLALAILGVLPNAAQVRGSIRLRATEIVGADENTLRPFRGGVVSLVPQEPALALSPVLRAGEQVADVIQAHRPWRRRKCREEAFRCLRDVGFSDEVERVFASYPHQLSGGQRQRVAIAQAVACEPELLIADEPTTSLDSTTQAEILELLRRLRRERGMSLLMISHDPAVLSEVADRVVVMQNGTLVESGPADVVFERPAHPYTRALVESARFAFS